MRRSVVVLVLLAACSSSVPAANQSTSAESTLTASLAATPAADPVDTPRSTISIPLSLYVVSDADGEDTGFATLRTIADVEEIVANIAPIWEQAGISFDPVNVLPVAFPADVLNEIAVTGRTDGFFAQAGVSFDIPQPGLINGFYVRDAAGVNGFTPIGSRVFFVVDQPSVHDERVSSHEIGHILGLHHNAIDPGRLLFSGTNGELIESDEQAVARYVAQGLLDGLR